MNLNPFTLLLFCAALLPLSLAQGGKGYDPANHPNSPPPSDPHNQNAPPPTIKDNINCVSGLHIVVPTGYADLTNPADPVEFRDLTALAKSIASGIPDSAAVAVHYPFVALDLQGLFMEEVKKGTSLVKQHVQNYVDTCGSESKIAILGYAQGALVATDTYVGSGANDNAADGYANDRPDLQWTPGTGLDQQYADSVIAAAVFASPTAYFHQAYSRGTALSNGMFATSRGPLSVSGEKFRSYCDEGDFMCAAVAMGRPKGSHTKTVKHYSQPAKEFIMEAWKRANGGD